MIEKLWDFFEIAVNFYQSYLLIYFCFRFLGDKHKRTFIASSGMSAAIVLAVVISIVNKITIFEHFFAAIYTAIIFLYCYFELNGKLIRKIFASVYVSLVASISAALVANMSTVIFRTNLNTILSAHGIKRFTAILLTQILLFYLIILSLKLFKKDNYDVGLIKSEWIMIISVLLISIAIGALINSASLKIDSSSGNWIVSLIFFLLFFVNIVVVIMAVDLSSKNITIRENEVLRIEKEYIKEYRKGMDEEYQLIRKLRHDINGILGTTADLIENRKYETAEQTIQSAMQMFDKKIIVIHTNNDIVNAIVNSKMSIAKSYGIEVQVMAPEEITGIDDFDLCRLLSNLLDNAINYCRNDFQEHRYIALKIVNEEQVIIINIKNSINSSVLEVNPSLISKDKDNGHGLGIGIIKEIALKYNGMCDFYEEENQFCCNVIMKRLS